MSSPTAHPLSWPLGHPRTHASHRDKARFSSTNTKSLARRSLTLPEAVARVTSELDRFTKVGQHIRVSHVVLSTNVPTRADGLPRGGLSEPGDPGAAVYFRLDGRPYCLPCDKYTRLADNLAAVAATIEATRTIERHGVITTHNVYADFKALPQQASGESWWVVLGFSTAAVTEAAIQTAYRRLAKTEHPDAGGDAHRMARLNNARREGLAAISK